MSLVPTSGKSGVFDDVKPAVVVDFSVIGTVVGFPLVVGLVGVIVLVGADFSTETGRVGCG